MKIPFRLILTTISFLALAGCSSNTEKAEFVAEPKSTIVTKEVNYQSNGKDMKAFLAVPEGEGPFPGVLVVHEWWGQTEYPRERARKLAEEGYVAMAIDMYGGGETLEHPDKAKAFASKVMANLDAAEENFKTALATLKTQEKVDPEKTAALGYCFGGAIVLEMARRGTDLKMVASYHGSLTPLVENVVAPVQTRMLIFNGADDPLVTAKDIASARRKLKDAKIRYKFISYQGAKHGFTNPKATEMGKKFDMPLEYSKRADEQSWQQTLDAFKIVFK